MEVIRMKNRDHGVEIQVGYRVEIHRVEIQEAIQVTDRSVIG